MTPLTPVRTMTCITSLAEARIRCSPPVELAVPARVSETTIRQLERGGSGPAAGLSRCRRWALALGLPPEAVKEFRGAVPALLRAHFVPYASPTPAPRRLRQAQPHQPPIGRNETNASRRFLYRERALRRGARSRRQATPCHRPVTGCRRLPAARARRHPPGRRPRLPLPGDIDVRIGVGVDGRR